MKLLFNTGKFCTDVQPKTDPGLGDGPPLLPRFEP